MFWIWDMIPHVVRKWMMLIIGLILLPGLPLLGYTVGADMEEWNINGLNQSPSYRHDPGAARAAVPDFSTIFLWTGLGFGALVFLICLLYFVYSKTDKRSPWT